MISSTSLIDIAETWSPAFLRSAAATVIAGIREHNDPLGTATRGSDWGAQQLRLVSFSTSTSSFTDALKMEIQFRALIGAALDSIVGESEDSQLAEMVEDFVGRFGVRALRFLETLLTNAHLSPIAVARIVASVGDAYRFAPKTIESRQELDVLLSFAIEHSHPSVRDAAATALIDVGDQVAHARLTRRLERETNDVVRRNLTLALEDF